GDGPAMLRFESKCSQDQEVQRALWKVNALCGHVLPFHFYTRYMISCRSTRETSQIPTLHHRDTKDTEDCSQLRPCCLLPGCRLIANYCTNCWVSVACGLPNVPASCG